jgi:replicative DNA helicase
MILSCLLINSDAIEVTIRNIPIDAFYFQNHQKFRAIIFMYRNKAPIDILTLITFYKIMAFCKIGG